VSRRPVARVGTATEAVTTKMSAKDLRELLERLDDTREIVLGPAPQLGDARPWLVDELLFCWREAADEAACAYRQWRERPGRQAYAVYRAAADRADAAQRELARSAARARLPR
jgi:hypothetical protein